MKKALFSILIFLITIALGELLLRVKVQVGYQTHYSGFIIVDSLIVYEDYRTDSAGNYVMSYSVTDTLKNQFEVKSCNALDFSLDNRISNTDGIEHILMDFCMLKSKTKGNTPFEVFANSIYNKDSLDEVDSAYLAYFRYPFNQQGFRSIPFQNLQTDKIKVLLVGDSFVWGMSANPYYNSFADILSAKNYVVYNAGISSVDPLQYYHVLDCYLDKINPDIAIINFYEGNDIMPYERVHAMNRPHEHITNAGFFDSHPAGEYLDAYQAYDFYKSELAIPKNSSWNRFLGKTAIGSLFWTFTNPDSRYLFREGIDNKQSEEITHNVLVSIDSLLQTKKSSYLFTVTPDNKVESSSDRIITIDSAVINSVFGDIAYHSPSTLTINDYNEPNDFHFNNSGSLKYANFIDALIQSKLKNVE